MYNPFGGYEQQVNNWPMPDFGGDWNGVIGSGPRPVLGMPPLVITPAMQRMPPNPSGGTAGIGAAAGIHGGVDRSEACHGSIGGSIRVFPIGATQAIDYLINQSAPTLIPSIPQAIILYLTDKITEEQLKCLTSFNGGVWQYVAEEVKAARSRPNVAMLMSLKNRGSINDEFYEARMRENGVIQPVDFSMIDILRQSIPSVNELVRMGVREAFSPQVVTDLGYYDEVPELVRQWFNAQGYHEGLGFEIRSDGNKREATWLDMWWASHWTSISPGQSYELLHRCRGDKNDPATWRIPGIKPFDIDDVRRWLKINDYPPSIRDHLAAVSYTPVTYRALFAALQTGIRNRQWVREAMQDQGRSASTSSDEADIMEARIDWDAAAPIRRIETGVVHRTFRAGSYAYKVGTLHKGQFLALMQNIGLSQNAADVYSDMIDSDIRTKKVERVLNALKRDYLNGTMDPAELVSLLPQTGISSERVQDYIQEWAALRTLERRTVSTEKIIAWYVKGLLIQPIAYQRLVNLGWSDPEALLYLAEAQLAIDKRDAALRAANLRTAKANASLIESELKKAKKQVTDLQSELKRLTPVGTLIKWARMGIISPEYFSNRLSSMGVPDDIIADRWQEVLKDGPIPKAARESVSVSGSPGGPTESGGSAEEGGTTEGEPEQPISPVKS